MRLHKIVCLQAREQNGYNLLLHKKYDTPKCHEILNLGTNISKYYTEQLINKTIADLTSWQIEND